MIISQTPLRVSFVGGGTDFEDFYRQYPGRVLSTSVDKFFYIGLNSRFDGAVKVSYSETELVRSSEQVRHPLVKAALQEADVKNGIDIVSLSDMPAHKTGLGLGASSSFTVGLLNVLYNFSAKYFPPEVLAEKACKIEIEKAGSPIGKQDQYAVAFGGLNVINFNTDGKVEVCPVFLPPKIKEDFQRHLLFFFTGRERSANMILSEQKQNINKKFEFLRKMSDMVPVFQFAIEKGNFKQAGEILNRNWIMKRELASGVSNSEIDKMYELAMKAGAYGGKVLGAGGGGFFLAIAPPENHHKIKESLAGYQVIPLRFSESGSKIIFKN